MVIAVLTILGVGFVNHSIAEHNICQRHADSVSSFWLAEAGMNHAFHELQSDFSFSGASGDVNQGEYSQGEYSVDVEAVGSLRRVVSHGSVTDIGLASTERAIEAVVLRGTPENFPDYAIYSSGDIDFNGDRYSVEGNVLYAVDKLVQHNNVNGTYTHDTTARPLGYLDFGNLRTISESQGNFYDADRLHDVRIGLDTFPESFWNSAPTDPSDPTTGIPNIVYVDCDLALNGDIGTIGGFYVVVGDVVTNPENIEDLSVNGCGEIDGVVYTRGDFVINGGAGGINIYGAVYAGEEARLNGNTHVVHEPYYQRALEPFLDDDRIRVIFWRDRQNPFKLSP